MAGGMHLAGVATEEGLELAKKICMEMGEYFQIQDDYLDCYGAPEVIGKIGTDIEDNKCSWLVVQALDRCTPEQRKILEVIFHIIIFSNETRSFSVGKLCQERPRVCQEGERSLQGAGIGTHFQGV